MVEIDLNNFANQQINVSIEEDYYSLIFRSFQGVTLATIIRNEKTIVESVLCHPNKNIIPYKGLTPKGNFRFDCITDDYPYYTSFNQTVLLRWYSKEELEQ